jgi:hypothetical protein
MRMEEAAMAVAEMRHTANELRKTANGDCNAIMQAIMWSRKADDLERAYTLPSQDRA